MVLTESELIALEELADFLEDDFVRDEEVCSTWADEAKMIRKLLSAQKRSALERIKLCLNNLNT